ncbi:metallophosphoesterase [Tessaracoccus sp.]
MTEPFSLLVIADTQYLFDGSRQNPELLTATFEEVALLQRTGAIAPLAHIVHVGDVTEHGWAEECSTALDVLGRGAQVLGGSDAGVLGMTIATGNHDVEHHSLDDRGPTRFLEAFGPGCELLGGSHVMGDVEHGPGGYSSWREVGLPGGPDLGVLALDWRPSDNGWRWAQEMLEGHPDHPTVLVSHDVASNAVLTPQGQRISELLARHPQVFLVLGGHEWPSTRVVTGGREYHAVNHQELPFGGAGAARIYDVDPRTGRCQVISLCPALRHPAVLQSVTARRQLALARPEDQFSFPLPAVFGGRGDIPWQADGMELLVDEAPEGVVEFDAALGDRYAIELQCRLPEAQVDRWQVLLARLGPSPDESPEPLAALSLSSENFLGWMAFVAGGETWATSHEYPPGSRVTIVVCNGGDAGVWVDGDPLGRVDAQLSEPLAEGSWRWRVGAGEYGGRYSDTFGGTIQRVRFWGLPIL